MGRFVAAIIALAAGVLYFYFKLLRPAGGNLLRNASFEDDPASPHFKPTGLSVMSLGNGATDVPEWQVLGKVLWSMENGSPAGIGFVAPKDGNFWLDLANHDPRGAVGVVRQSVWLERDRDYRLEVHVRPVPLGTVTLTVTVENDGVVRYQHSAASPWSDQWQRLTFGFDTSGWSGTGTDVIGTIAIGAPPGQGKSVIGIDSASLLLMAPILPLPR